jgi:hypothetical protein
MGLTDSGSIGALSGHPCAVGWSCLAMKDDDLCFKFPQTHGRTKWPDLFSNYPRRRSFQAISQFEGFPAKETTPPPPPPHAMRITQYHSMPDGRVHERISADSRSFVRCNVQIHSLIGLRAHSLRGVIPPMAAAYGSE